MEIRLNTFLQLENAIPSVRTLVKQSGLLPSSCSAIYQIVRHCQRFHLATVRLNFGYAFFSRVNSQFILLVSGAAPSSPLMVPTLSRNSINCSENFIWNGNYCLPACPNWALRSNSATADDIIVITSAVIGLISGTLFFIVSGLRYRRM